MQRKTVQLGNYQYLLEYLDGHEHNHHTGNFVMMRKYTSINDVIIDTDIFIFEKQTYIQLQRELNENKNADYKIQSIVFPVPDSQLSSYSFSYTDFNINFTRDSFGVDDDNINYGDISEYGDVYELCDSEGNETNLLCDQIKLYYPITRTQQPIIVCIENYINGIHFYYLCNIIDNAQYQSETQIEVNHQVYSQYYSFYFPNFYELFKFNETTGKGTVYYKENITHIVSSKNDEFISKITNNTKNIDSYFNDNSTIQLIPLGLLIQPFKIVEETIEYKGETITRNVKLYLKTHSSIENNYVSFPINICVFPYNKKLSKSSSLYVLEDNMMQNVISFSSKYVFKLSSKLGFNNGNIAILTKFKYPLADQFDDSASEKSKVLQAYEYFYNVNADDYEDFSGTEIAELEDIENMTVANLTEYDRNVVKYALTSNKSILDEQTLNAMPNQMSTFTFNDQIDYGLLWKDLRSAGLKLQPTNIIKDPDNDRKCQFKGISKIVLNKIDKAIKQPHTHSNPKQDPDFKYDMTNDEYVLTIYKELKRIGIIQEYEDEFDSELHFIGFEIEIATDKAFNRLVYKQYKTISIKNLNDFTFEINDIFTKWAEMPETLVARIMFIDRYLNNVIISNYVVITKEWFKYMINHSNYGKLSVLETQNKDMKEIVLQNGNINFINSINCSIVKEQNNIAAIPNRNSPKVMYKPIFYKVSDLQLIRIRKSVKQNIGVNLLNYMTKVDTFKLLIDGQEIVESMRNDAYVIFSIDGHSLSTTGGTYDIITQDDEYINTGNWITY